MSNRLATFDHVGVVVQDLEASIAWYADHLGFERQSDFSFPGARVAFIVRGALRLELFQIEGAAPMAPERKRAAPRRRGARRRPLLRPGDELRL